jgi:CHAT domain-containing protein/tetratricopeptide (TPR) repeat protein
MGKMLGGAAAVGLAALVLLTPGRAQAQADKPPDWTPEEKELAGKAAKLNQETMQCVGLGKMKEAVEKGSEAVALCRKLYPPERFPDGHADLEDSLSNMGGVLQALGEPARALPYFEQALAMARKLYPPERFPDGQPALAMGLNNMGGVLNSLGEPARALPYFEQALAMHQKLYPAARFPDGHADLARSLHNMGYVLLLVGEPAKALPYFERALAAYRKLHPPERAPDGHPDLARSLNTIAFVLDSLGEPVKALAYSEQALAMRQKLFPPERFPTGHPDLARSLNNVGYMLDTLREHAKALPYYERALAMRQKLYPPERFPDGHPELVTSLNNVGAALRALGEPAKALPYFEQALALNRKLYAAQRFPDGHPQLAISLDAMGRILNALGEPAKARAHYQESQGMFKKLYPPERFPDGHPDLAESLIHTGLLRSPGEPADALADFGQALVMYGRLGRREMGQASEAQALAYRGTQLGAESGYLSVAARVPPSGALYGPLWQTRGGLLPLLQARHQAVLARVAASADARKDYDDLVAVRRKIGRLQGTFPRNDRELKARDKDLADLNDEQDRLERRLASQLPEFKRLRELAEKGPADLARRLPPGSAFVDFIRYTQLEKAKSVGRRYVAFVVLPGRDALFVPLGDAEPIDAAVAAWRKHIGAGQDSLAPAKLRELVWDKVAKELPDRTRVVYVCPDGDLARLPFAALPGARPGTILLEDHALAVVPSGPWLLEQLLYPAKRGDAPERVLAIGDVAYGPGGAAGQETYAALAGTGRELKRVLEAFGQEGGDALAGAAATVAAVRERLPAARYAHFATHAYFDEASLSAERRRLSDYLENWSFQADARRPGQGGRNPAGYVGLALAGANDPAGAGPDGGILTGLGVVDLPLEKIRLCVLSACETGLGDLTEGEGVAGLQRAFHAAGCPNVVGSLWKVNDAATAALMAQFYHELRANKRPPLDALRGAQLALYRHPERIAALAGERGRPAQEAAAKLGSAAAPAKPDEKTTTPTRLWAAFVLSGVGTGE